MGKRGPPPLPTAIKKLHGTLKKSRTVPNEVCPPLGLPPRPPDLDDLAGAVWDDYGARLLDLGVLTHVDGNVFEGYCRAYSRAVKADRIIEKKGILIRTPYGPKRNPAIHVSEAAWDTVNRLGGKLGLSPSDRTRVSASPKAKTTTTEDEFFGRPALKALDGGKGGAS